MSSRARHAVVVAVVIALAVLAHAPSLSWGFFADDHGLMLMLERPIEHPTLRWWSLFDFGGAPAAGDENAAWSFVPWWTSPDWKVRFFRPLASLSHALDFALFERAAVPHHATSLTLYAALLVLLHALYRAAGLARSVALWSLAVFAFEDGAVMPVGWIANRNTLLEALCAVASVLVVLRGGASPSRWRLASALALALLACLAKESGVVTFAALSILLAWLARRGADPNVCRRLVRWSVASLVSGLAYIAFLLLAGYGTQSLFYVLPWTQPVTFGQRTLLMLVLGAQGALGPFSIDVAMMFPRLFVPWIAISLALGVPVAARIAWVERALPLGAFFAAWSFLALVPQAGTYPSDRLLFVPMIGLAPWIGAFASRALERVPWRRRWLPILVAVSSVPFSLALTAFRSAWLTPVVHKLGDAIVSADVPRDGARCDALVLQAPSMLTMLSPDPVWVFNTGVESVRFHPLQVGRVALRVTLADQRTLELESVDALLVSPMEQVFLSRAELPAVGEVRRARGFTVEILAVDTSGVRRVRVKLDEPAASERWRFLTWNAGAFRRVELPLVGQTLDLPRCEPLDPMLP